LARKRTPAIKSSVLTKEDLSLLNPKQLRRLNAITNTYLMSLEGVEVAKPGQAECQRALLLSAAGYSLEQILTDIGYTSSSWESFLQFKDIALVNQAMSILYKAHLDDELNRAVDNPEVNLRAIQVKMKHNSEYFNDDVFKTSEDYANLPTQEKVKRVINMMAKGDVSVSQSQKLLEAISKLEELSQLPKLEEQLEQLKNDANLIS